MKGVIASLGAAAIALGPVPAMAQDSGTCEEQGWIRPVPFDGAWRDNYGDERPASIPYRVRLFVIAAQACGHFSGEEAYDAERAEFLTGMIEETCIGLEERRAAILKDHGDDPETSALVAEVWEVFDD